MHSSVCCTLSVHPPRHKKGQMFAGATFSALSFPFLWGAIGILMLLSGSHSEEDVFLQFLCTFIYFSSWEAVSSAMCSQAAPMETFWATSLTACSDFTAWLYFEWRTHFFYFTFFNHKCSLRNLSASLSSSGGRGSFASHQPQWEPTTSRCSAAVRSSRWQAMKL